jgi:hypothetical protein
MIKRVLLVDEPTQEDWDTFARLQREMWAEMAFHACMDGDTEKARGYLEQVFDGDWLQDMRCAAKKLGIDRSTDA